jgi:hypothetical protein
MCDLADLFSYTCTLVKIYNFQLFRAQLDKKTFGILLGAKIVNFKVDLL